MAARAVAFAFPLAVAAALLVARGRFPGRAALDAVLQAPLVLSPVAVGLILLLALGREGPLGGPLERAFGVRLVFTQAGAALAAAVGAFPLMVRTARVAVEAVDRAYETAAASLGAEPLDRLLSVTLPLAAPGLLAALVLGFSACLGEFGAVATFAGDVPGVTETVPLAIWSRLQTPGGEVRALRLAAVSFLLSGAGVVLSEVLARRVRAGRLP